MNKLERIPTGIQDINERMIFVDDIVKVTYGDAQNNFSENEKVIYDNGKFYLDHHYGTSSFDSPHYSLEVIGNIHDNPELFNKGRRISFWGD